MNSSGHSGKIFGLFEKIIRKKEGECTKQEQKEKEFLRKLIEKKRAKEEKISREYIEKVKKKDSKQREMEIKKKIEEDEAKIDCPMCFDQLFSNEKAEDTIPFAFQMCDDVFHKGCLRNYLKEEIQKKVFPIKCPNAECGKEISDKDIKDIIKGQSKLLRKYEDCALDFALNSNKDYFRCLTPDCTYAFCMTFEDPQMNCPLCRKSYCMSCKVDWHKGMTCQQYKIKRKKEIAELEKTAEEAFLKCAREKGYRKCPKCGQFIEKIEGCKAIFCLMCRTAFCFSCGSLGNGHNCMCSGL